MKAGLRILLVDDHPLFADAIITVLARLGHGATVRAVASAEDALIELDASAAPFDLVLLDLGLPELRGTAAYEAIAARARDAPILIVTGSEPSAEAHALVEAGARGLVHKRARSSELLAILRSVLDGGVPPEVVPAIDASERAIALTPRQREVLAMLARGLSDRNIAQELGLSESTVRAHVGSVLRALDVESRTQAATSPYARSLIES